MKLLEYATFFPHRPSIRFSPKQNVGNADLEKWTVEVTDDVF